MLIDVMRKLSLHMLRIFITLQPIHIQRMMEASVLQSLKFEMGNLTTKTFLRRFTMVAQEDYNNPDLQLEFLCYYLAELSLPDHHCEILAFFGSCCCEISVKVHFTAKVLESGPSTRSGYRAADLKDCVLIIHDFQLNRRGSTLAAVRNKYKQHKFKCMSTLSSPLEILDCFFEDTC
ncbi:cyclin-A3-1-like [Lycium barbarum]|uniref:cyclin-A3-1-like n=1 Tax=Lycium barbarum TaxID=112863 RepID=UPI00293F3FFE|nr:cyclin-A3-1-like [Lycium barbarum]